VPFFRNPVSPAISTPSGRAQSLDDVTARIITDPSTSRSAAQRPLHPIRAGLTGPLRQRPPVLPLQGRPGHIACALLRGLRVVRVASAGDISVEVEPMAKHRHRGWAEHLHRDPALIDALASGRRVVTFDNTEVGGSSGKPRTRCGSPHWGWADQPDLVRDETPIENPRMYWRATPITFITPGLRGLEEGGQRAEAVRRKPYRWCCWTTWRRRTRTWSTPCCRYSTRAAHRRPGPHGRLPQHGHHSSPREIETRIGRAAGRRRLQQRRDVCR
jgi:hypothetical protein